NAICSTGSMPFCSRKWAAARLDMWTLAPAPSVTLSAAARPFSGSAAARKAAGSVDTGGDTSAVMVKRPAARLRCKSLLIWSLSLKRLKNPAKAHFQLRFQFRVREDVELAVADRAQHALGDGVGSLSRRDRGSQRGVGPARTLGDARRYRARTQHRDADAAALQVLFQRFRERDHGVLGCGVGAEA